MFTVNDYCKEQFGSKVYKISLSGGMTCPNRDGKCGNRGCIFCSSGGSGEFSADVPYGKEMAETKLKYLLLSMTTHSFSKENRIFEETLSYIKNNILSINSNEEIAQFMNYHSYYLNKIFKEKTGTSMHRYIINERLKIAADLLITTSHNVNEVAKLSGFENSRHFSTAFMKKYKCTPSSMRKRSKTFI